jgi:D-alanyl-D-alanine carboxypeptidase
MTCNHCIRLLSTILLLTSGAARTCADGPDLTHSMLGSWQDKLTDWIEQPRFENAHWGIKVVSLDTGNTLFERNSHKYFQPASNAKLFTAALVLARLGP